MDLIDCREYIMTLPMAEECQPFDEDIVVYKICGRWFASISFSRGNYIAVKCHPERAVLLRDEYLSITPAWHYNKRYWNDLLVTALPEDVVKREIRHSYFMVIRKNISPKAVRQELLATAAQLGIIDDAVVPQ